MWSTPTTSLEVFIFFSQTKKSFNFSQLVCWKWNRVGLPHGLWLSQTKNKNIIKEMDIIFGEVEREPGLVGFRGKIRLAWMVRSHGLFTSSISDTPSSIAWPRWVLSIRSNSRKFSFLLQVSCAFDFVFPSGLLICLLGKMWERKKYMQNVESLMIDSIYAWPQMILKWVYEFELKKISFCFLV